MRITPRFQFGLWILALAVGGEGCSSDSIAPRRPTIVANYSTPTLTLETLAKGIEDKGRTNGQDVYMGAFAESSAASPGDGRAYHAFFDPSDLGEQASWNPDQDWNKALEHVLYADLVQRFASPYEMVWEPYEPLGNETGNATDSLLHRKYKIVQLIQTDSTVVSSPIAIGAAELYFVRSASTNRWAIAIWQDFRVPDADSAFVTLGRRRLETQ